MARQARGIDSEPVVPPSVPPVISVERDLSEDINDREALTLILRTLIIELVITMQKRSISACRASLQVLYSDGLHARGSFKTRYPTRDLTVWLTEFSKLFETNVTRRIRVRSMRIQVSELIQERTQYSLFDTDCTQGRKQPSDAAAQLLGALSKIREKFGKEALKWGVM
jgi:nucleotidyltransferase/DNA polymerase involved in DNA repair